MRGSSGTSSLLGDDLNEEVVRGGVDFEAPATAAMAAAALAAVVVA
jgi:hypothetical protein